MQGSGAMGQHRLAMHGRAVARMPLQSIAGVLARQHPGYGLERHAGYGTAVHRQAVLAHGPTSLHRRSFLRKLLGA